jgi:glycosyltransferase involved in cell wall biosynthesis/predicted SAM-dependent methyltransferase
MGDQHSQSGAELKINSFYISQEYLPKKKLKLCEISQIKKNPVLLVIPEMSGAKPSPCSYIRLLVPLTLPAIDAHYNVRVTSLQTATTVSADVVVLNRVPCAKVVELEDLLLHVREMGAKLVYDIDDQLLDLGDKHPEASLYREKQDVVRALLDAADLVCVSTAALAEALHHMCKKIEVFENFLPLQYFEENESDNAADVSGKFNILYMGTATHGADLNLALEALRKLHAEGERFELHLVGITANPPTDNWIKVIQPPTSATSYPLFMQWLRSLQKFDLGIAPLESGAFNICKSGIKFWDYTSIGIPTLASNVTAYNSIILHGETGYLASNNTNDWYKKLRDAMENKNNLGAMVSKAKSALRSLYTQINGAERRKQTLITLVDGLKRQPSDDISEAIPQSREEIAAKYLLGLGIEIGALHNPLAIPSNAKAKYVDRMPKEKLYEHYPELRAYSLVDVDIVDDGEFLNTVSDNSQDFVIANHFLEHSEDPIVTLTNLLRVTKIGGVIYLAVPNMLKTFDCNREQTTLSHVIDDHKLGVETSRRRHYEEWVSLVEPHFGRAYDEITFKNRVDELLEQKYSIHFHCWDTNGFKEFLRFLQNDCSLLFDVSVFVEREDEYISILTKRSAA